MSVLSIVARIEGVNPHIRCTCGVQIDGQHYVECARYGHDVLPEDEKTRRRYCRCCCCGSTWYTDKPHDPERDTGYGTCTDCHERVAASWVKYGFPGDRPITLEAARERLARYA
jgi:hypothetical protein